MISHNHPSSHKRRPLSKLEGVCLARTASKKANKNQRKKKSNRGHNLSYSKKSLSSCKERARPQSKSPIPMRWQGSKKTLFKIEFRIKVIGAVALSPKLVRPPCTPLRQSLCDIR